MQIFLNVWNSSNSNICGRCALSRQVFFENADFDSEREDDRN